jgi:hypothetical protein
MMERLGSSPIVHKVEGVGWGFEEMGRQGALKLPGRSGGLKTNTVLCSNDRLSHRAAVGLLRRGNAVGRASQP